MRHDGRVDPDTITPAPSKAMRYARCSTALLLLSACGQSHWLAMIYPDKANLQKSLDFGEYTSLPKCRRAAIEFLAYIGKSETGDYECGKNCEPTFPEITKPQSPQFDKAALMTCSRTER